MTLDDLHKIPLQAAYRSRLKPGEWVVVKIVFVAGEVDDFAAYLGASDDDDRYIKDHGDKIPEQAAVALAPWVGMTRLRFRR